MKLGVIILVVVLSDSQAGSNLRRGNLCKKRKDIFSEGYCVLPEYPGVLFRTIYLVRPVLPAIS